VAASFIVLSFQVDAGRCEGVEIVHVSSVYWKWLQILPCASPRRVRTVTVPDYRTLSLIKRAAAVQKSGHP